jgi:hypothetical protein
MFNLFQWEKAKEKVDLLSRLVAERTARRMDNSALFEDAFTTLIRFAARPFNARALSTNWCEVWYSAGDCYFPYGQGKCAACREDAPCPDGYKPSFAYEYSSTGCWCVAQTPYITKICCDCTPHWNNPYVRHPLDCQCGQTVHNEV